MSEFICLTLAMFFALPVFLLAVATPAAKFALSSSAFGSGKAIPTRHANKGVSGGQNISPPLSWANLPEGTKSLGLACIDRHPIANDWVHWLVINIPATVNGLSEGASRTTMLPAGTKELENTFGTMGWGGPPPPPGSGTHPYESLLYALSVENLNLPVKTNLASFNKAINGKVLATAKLVGTYER
ncbi:MAG: YbhB/YbcL family Raf kinase inhibitor-like protein [Acidobacteria bacterium]|nr:YbhB/YbcL family Raf kinase inhibitor-like protein [Acidobacteriota bacterium]